MVLGDPLAASLRYSCFICLPSILLQALILTQRTCSLSHERQIVEGECNEIGQKVNNVCDIQEVTPNSDRALGSSIESQTLNELVILLYAEETEMICY